jgi:uncharacterized protein
MNADAGELPAFGRAQCLTLMRTVRIGRVVYTDQALPAVTPVNFVVDGDAVIIHTGSGSTLAAALRGTVAAFEVDHVDSETGNGWWVTVTGRTQLLGATADVAYANRLPLRPWVQAPNAQFVRISCQHVSGGRFDLAAHADPVDGSVSQPET